MSSAVERGSTWTVLMGFSGNRGIAAAAEEYVIGRASARQPDRLAAVEDELDVTGPE